MDWLEEIRARVAAFESAGFKEPDARRLLEEVDALRARLALAERVIDAAAVVHRDCDTNCRCDRWAPADAPPCVGCAAWERLDSAMLAYDAALTGERAT